MEARISHAGKRHDLVTYSQLVEGLTFHLPTVNEGVRFQIDTSNWRDLDRAILGEFLGHISADTFRAAGFFATALVVTQEDRVPSEQFFKWMRSLGMIRHRGRDAEIEFWIGEVKKAHDWYSMHQPRA